MTERDHVLIARVLPSVAVAEEAYADTPGTHLFPEEEAAVARAVDKRRREFATVRACARRALHRLGAPRVPLVPGERGAPDWPAGVVGSMTHCLGFRAAAVAWGRDIASVGIDAEPAEPLPADVFPSVASPDERARLAVLARDMPEVPWDRLLFSAKESVYKAWFPLTRRWLGFEEADVTFDAAAGTFTARLCVADRPRDAFAGRWAVHDGIAVTGIAVAHD
jgi:4'-phosphopantetheinyl transferase EntD